MSENTRTTISATARRHALLTGRARRLARPRKAALAVESISCLVCEAGQELFGLPLTRLVRVVPARRPAALPTSNAALVGVTGHAGVFYHVYDLARLVTGAASERGEHFAMLRGTPSVALRVDQAVRVAELVALDASETSRMRANHPAVSGFARAVQAELFEGRVISLIDPDKLASEHAPEGVEGD